MPSLEYHAHMIVQSCSRMGHVTGLPLFSVITPFFETSIVLYLVVITNLSLQTIQTLTEYHLKIYVLGISHFKNLLRGGISRYYLLGAALE